MLPSKCPCYLFVLLGGDFRRVVVLDILVEDVFLLLGQALYDCLHLGLVEVDQQLLEIKTVLFHQDFVYSKFSLGFFLLVLLLLLLIGWGFRRDLDIQLALDLLFLVILNLSWSRPAFVLLDMGLTVVLMLVILIIFWSYVLWLSLNEFVNALRELVFDHGQEVLLGDSIFCYHGIDQVSKAAEERIVH